MIFKNITLDYDFDIFLNADYSVHEGSEITYITYELTDIHKKYGGFPKSYCYENTKKSQLWWDEDQVDFKEIGQQLGIEVVSISSILQPPGCVIPLHRDIFYQIGQKYPSRTDTKVRANIFLEDWKLGHMIQFMDIVSTHWRQGNGYMFDDEILHLSANAGMESKYTLQVSGFLVK